MKFREYKMLPFSTNKVLITHTFIKIPKRIYQTKLKQQKHNFQSFYSNLFLELLLARIYQQRVFFLPKSVNNLQVVRLG